MSLAELPSGWHSAAGTAEQPRMGSGDPASLQDAPRQCLGRNWGAECYKAGAQDLWEAGQQMQGPLIPELGMSSLRCKLQGQRKATAVCRAGSPVSLHHAVAFGSGDP